MAHHKSAIKRIRRNERANVRNRQYLSAVKTAVKKFRFAAVGAAQGTFDKEAVKPLFVHAQSMLAKAASKGVLHKNAASRRIGRLSAVFKAAQEGKLVGVPQKAGKKTGSPKA